MKHLIKYLITITLLSGTQSCHRDNPKDHVHHLNGYWEIDKVQTSQAVKKQYSFNQSIDFIEMSGDSLGIRKKVQPQLDGTFITSKNNERFKIIVLNDSIYLEYTTPYDTWRETLVSVKEDELILRNPNGNLYFYRPYKKLDLQ
ncbi:hypothetical protein ACE939_09090 [Aquimarina sp. W85]|uniref:hypothetical protein n=1 Tax=Aquimarina rhodophyticola TaxID=3342246 RepID=UPI0036716A00